MPFQKPKATPIAVRSALIKKHKTWVIPEGRLNKFVKKQKAGKPMTEADDQTLGSKISNYFTIKSTPPEKAPKKKKHTPKLSNGKPVTVKTKTEPKKEEPAPAPAAAVEEVVEKSAYVDDNDGKKEGPCAECIIL